MSHFTTLRTHLVDRECLCQALSDLGHAYEEGEVSIRGFGGQRTKVELRVPTRSPGYQLGFRRLGARYELVADWYGIRDIEAKPFLNDLTRRYAYHAARKALEAQQFDLVEEEIQPDQSIRLVLRRYAE